MASKAALAVALFLAASLAGCSGDGDDGGDSSSTSSSGSRITYTATVSPTTSSSATTTSASSTSGSPSNQAPTGSISASVNGTQARFNLTGSDPDGDALVWDLAFGDGNATNGTTLPTSVTHAYNATGNLTATFTLTDGTARSSYNVTVQLAGGAAGQTASLTYTGGAFGCGAEFDPMPAGLPAAGVLYGEIVLEPATLGKPYRMTMTWASTPASLGGDIAFYDADGAYVDGNLISGSSPLTFEGTLPAAANHAIVTTCDAGAQDVAIEYAAG